MEKTIAEQMTQFCLGLNYDSIPSQVLEKSKDLILDTLGICTRSASLESGGIILDLVRTWGGAAESSLVGSATKVSMQNAAFANGVLAHALDYDDTHTEAVVHPSACLVPVALSAGERTGCSGKEVLTALVGGLEAMIRLGLPALNRFHMRGFHTTSICGTFASALVAGRLMKLSAAEVNNALGIAGSFTSGLLECLSFGSWAKQLHAGWAGLCGIIAAQLAQRGFTGPLSVFEGRLGLYNSFLRSETLDFDLIFKYLGKEWEVLNIRPKLYPCCHYLQAFIDCGAYLRKEYNIDHGAIQKIVCRVSEGAANIICSPWESKLAPATDYDLKFSLPYAVALILVKGRAGFKDFSLKVSEDPAINALMGKVTYEVEPTFKVKDMPGALEIRLNDGRSLAHRIDQVRGDARQPITREELLGKFYDNCDTIFSREKSKKSSELIFDFEHQHHIRKLLSSFTGVDDEN